MSEQQEVWKKMSRYGIGLSLLLLFVSTAFDWKWAIILLIGQFIGFLTGWAGALDDACEEAKRRSAQENAHER